jgi:hypothetical protein
MSRVATNAATAAKIFIIVRSSWFYAIAVVKIDAQQDDDSQND